MLRHVPAPLILLSTVAFAAAEVRLAGDWSIQVEMTGEQAVKGRVEIRKLGLVTVENERHEKLPDFDFQTKAGWRKGARLAGVKAEECTVQGALDPASLVVKDGPGAEAKAFRRGADFEADLDAGTVGRVPGGAIGIDQPVFVSYRYGQQRIDSIVVAGGRLSVREGSPHAVTPAVPALRAGEVRLANVHVQGRDDELRADSLFPILEDEYPEPVRDGPPPAARLLPKTWAKLRSGEPLRILAWGDSVSTYNRYQTMFADRLRERFPAAKIELVTEAWGGRSTLSYLKEPPASEHNYEQKVLARKPDLVISEFVNDASLNEAQVEERYSKLLADFQRIGAEWIILSPHYVRPDWMGLKSQREIDDDPRPYVKGIRIFAEKHGVALADASRRYGRLWRRGIPYLTLMENNINHPNVFGHGLFADSLPALFQTR